MNFNISGFLTNSMRILNIVNRALPLIKEVNPAINFVRTKMKNVNSIQPPKQLPPNTNSMTINQNNKRIITNNNSLTFFK